jgi:hypothetical protein
MDEVTTTPAASGLDVLAARAAELEGQHAPPPPPGTPEPMTPEDTAHELRGALEMVRLMASPAFAWWPQFGQVWSDQTLQAMATNGAVIMERHGWTVGQALAEWGPYIGLIGATLPPALATYQAVQTRKLEARQPRPVPNPGPPPEAAP